MNSPFLVDQPPDQSLITQASFPREFGALETYIRWATFFQTGVEPSDSAQAQPSASTFLPYGSNFFEAPC